MKQNGAVLNLKNMPRDLMSRMRITAAHLGTTMRQFVIDTLERALTSEERKRKEGK